MFLNFSIENTISSRRGGEQEEHQRNEKINTRLISEAFNKYREDGKTKKKETEKIKRESYDA